MKYLHSSNYFASLPGCTQTLIVNYFVCLTVLRRTEDELNDISSRKKQQVGDSLHCENI